MESPSDGVFQGGPSPPLRILGGGPTVCVLPVARKPCANLVCSNSYLPGRGDTMIKKVVCPGRGSAIAHPVVLTPANSSNVGISTAQFLVVGDCVRALP